VVGALRAVNGECGGFSATGDSPRLTNFGIGELDFFDVIMGEFGAFDFVEETFEEAAESTVIVRDLALNAILSGMLFWTYVQKPFRTASIQAANRVALTPEHYR
jgi:hypothetical protein